MRIVDLALPRGFERLGFALDTISDAEACISLAPEWQNHRTQLSAGVQAKIAGVSLAKGRCDRSLCACRNLSGQSAPAVRVLRLRADPERARVRSAFVSGRPEAIRPSASSGRSWARQASASRSRCLAHYRLGCRLYAMQIETSMPFNAPQRLRLCFSVPTGDSYEQTDHSPRGCRACLRQLDRRPHPARADVSG